MSGSQADQFICLGVITSAIGVRGEVRIKTFTKTPERLADYGTIITQPDGQQLDIAAVRVVKDGLGVFLDGVNDRDAAQALSGTEIGVMRDALGDTDEDDTFYHVDLVGLRVQDGEGVVLGDVKAVHDFGGGDVLEIRLDGQEKTKLVPFRKETVPELDIKAGFLVLLETTWLETGKGKEGEGE